MVKERKRDRLLRLLRSRGTSNALDSQGAPPQISSSVLSSTSVLTGIGLGSPAEIHTSNPPSSQHLTTPTLSDTVGTKAVPIESESLLLSESITATITRNDTASNEGTNDEAVSSTQTSANNAQRQPLWIQAFNQLSSAESAALAPFYLDADSRDILSILESIQKEMDRAMACKRDKGWTVKWRGEDIVLRDIAMKIMQWVDKFKQIGDIIVQYDPGHAALPWAAFRFLLQVCVNRQDTADAILIGLEKSSNLIDRCAVYESIYLKEDTDASRILVKAMLKLYTAILKFLAKSIEVSKDNALQSLFTVEELSRSFGNIETREIAVEGDANAARAQNTAVEFNRLRTFLDELRITSARLGNNFANINQMLEVSVLVHSRRRFLRGVPSQFTEAHLP
ncbi:hypothetical protein BDD12DRAFT_892728 [Trichophaea hybrida]|nr:hypothetical protein BDD12DRAFT_892728 [Trichophaea hybrida]